MGDKVAVFARYPLDPFVLADAQLIKLGHTPVILERLRACGLFVHGGHGDVADLQQLRRGEEHHVGGVVVNRIDDAPLFDEHGVQVPSLQLDGAGQTGGPGAYDDRVVGAHSKPSTSL
jgi:hypothetical protein